VPEYTLTLLIWDTIYEKQGYGLSSLPLWGVSNLTPVGTLGSFPGSSSYDLPQSSSCMKNISSLEDCQSEIHHVQTLKMEAASSSNMSALHRIPQDCQLNSRAPQ